MRALRGEQVPEPQSSAVSGAIAMNTFCHSKSNIRRCLRAFSAAKKVETPALPRESIEHETEGAP